MGKNNLTDLLKFLMPFPDEVKDNTLWLRSFIWDLYPDCNELIYDNYNALAIAFGLTDKAGDAFCGIAIYSKHINFGFNRGSELADPDGILKGDGSLYRYMTIKNINQFPERYITELMRDAYDNALSRLKPAKKVIKGQTITKMISATQRRPDK